MAAVEVTVPDGVHEGQEFMLSYDGRELLVCCPDGCGPGMLISLELPPADESPTGSDGAPNPALVEITVPDGCYPGDTFTVTYEERSFDIVVPDGCNPGDPLTVEVPADAPVEPTKPKSPAKAKSPAKLPSERKASHLEKQPAPLLKREKPSAAKYLTGLDIPAFKGPRKGVTANSVNADAKWRNAGDLFSAMPSEGLGKEAGDFEIGQLIQVARNDGTWTYGKIMDYDPSGDVYSVMTRAGPKHFVERSDITDDVCVNPGDGGCAQQ